MDDRYAINVAKTKLREAYKNGDVDAILALFSDSFIDMRENQGSFWDMSAKTALRIRLEKLFCEQDVELVPIIIDIEVSGDLAVEHGWHNFIQRPKLGGPPAAKRMRYVEIWRREPDQEWRIVFLIDKVDQTPELLEQVDNKRS